MNARALAFVAALACVPFVAHAQGAWIFAPAQISGAGAACRAARTPTMQCMYGQLNSGRFGPPIYWPSIPQSWDYPALAPPPPPLSSCVTTRQGNIATTDCY